MNRFRGSAPGFLQRRKPIIRCRFITNATPDPLLDIQSRLIRRQILYREPPMILKKNIDAFSFMPSGAVHIKPDLISPQSPVKLPQAQKKPFSIPLGMPDQPRFSQKRRDPTKDIQPRPMLACGRNPKPPAAFGPTHTQTRMERKPRFVFKHHRLLRSQIFEFFLRPEKISGRPQNGLEDRHSFRASNDTLIGASTSGPGGPLVLSQTGVSYERRGSAHPSEPGLTQIPEGTVPDRFRALFGSSRSAASVGPVAATLLKPRRLVRSRYASNDSGSDGLSPKCR